MPLTSFWAYLNGTAGAHPPWMPLQILLSVGHLDKKAKATCRAAQKMICVTGRLEVMLANP